LRGLSLRFNKKKGVNSLDGDINNGVWQLTGAENAAQDLCRICAGSGLDLARSGHDQGAILTGKNKPRPNNH
jgi:hypothetical protein